MTDIEQIESEQIRETAGTKKVCPIDQREIIGETPSKYGILGITKMPQLDTYVIVNTEYNPTDSSNNVLLRKLTTVVNVEHPPTMSLSLCFSFGILVFEDKIGFVDARNVCWQLSAL